MARSAIHSKLHKPSAIDGDVAVYRPGVMGRVAAFTLERLAEMARFNFGSTVIVLLPKGVAELVPQLRAKAPVKLGERVAPLV